jgi:hypothetical protein
MLTKTEMDANFKSKTHLSKAVYLFWAILGCEFRKSRNKVTNYKLLVTKNSRCTKIRRI